ncbi:unnamed protein product [uncultured bacterium]|nr:unnamed protein product [uncultured bacterium]
MTPARWSQVRSIFFAAQELEMSARATFINEASAGDADVERDVLRLLALDAQAGSFLERPAMLDLASSDPPIGASVFEVAAQQIGDDASGSWLGQQSGNYRLPAGAHLGPYEVIAPLGVGGMGEVYKALDTRLDRTVAVKIISSTMAGDPRWRDRFGREARAVSALNHPHICTLHDVGEHGGTAFLVMEYLDGETLADRLTKGALPLDEALKIAIHIADALDAAHRHGIVHRDLKPGNVMLTKAGAKLLDFGLAKASGVTAGAGLSMLPTTPANLTAQGTILGTFQYMAPEQLEGHEADARSDIFAFGAVLYETLTGRKAFVGKSQASLIGAIMHGDPPPVSEVLPLTPVWLNRLVATCLAKDPDDRWQSAGDLKRELKWVAEGSVSLDSPAAVSPPAALRSAWSRKRWWTLTAAAISMALAIAAALTWRRVDPERLIYASLDAPAESMLGEDDALVHLPTRPPFVFTPDGRSLIIQVSHAGNIQLVLRALDRPDARPIAGTNGARAPFVSPDGKWVGFFAANEIRKVPIEGGTPTTICPLIAPLGPIGAAWGARDVIVFGDMTGRIMRVSSGGGAPAPVTVPSAPRHLHVAPSFLPDGVRFLFSDVSILDVNDGRVMVQSLDGGDAKIVLASATDGRLLPTGQLAFMRLGTLMINAFDLARAEVIGAPVSALGGVMQSGLRARAGANNTGAGMFAVSSRGDLAVVRGPLIGGEEDHLRWVARDGGSSSAEPATGGPSGHRLYSRISPDRSRDLVTVITRTRIERWIADWKRDVWTPCGDCAGDTVLPAIWSPDGQRILQPVYDKLVAHSLDAAASDQVIVQEADRTLEPRAWLRDGRIVYESRPASPGNTEVKVLDPGASVGQVVLPAGVGRDSEVSPDHRWLAYTAMQAEPTNVVVQPFPGPGARTQVSAGGGREPLWSADGHTLYYLKGLTEPPGTAVLAADVAASTDIIAVGTPRELFRSHEPQACTGRCYDVAEGPRFLLVERTSEVKSASVTRFDLVLNWTSTLPMGR